jgi:hypothetical protein
MLLAAILGICLLSPATSPAAGTVLVSEPGPSAPSGTPADSPAPRSQDSSTAPQKPEKSSAPSSQPAPASTPAQSSPAPATTHQGRWRRKKRAATPDCPNSTGAAKGSESAGATDSPKASGGCSTAKTVVRDGGTSEPTVQLKGSGSGGRGSHQGDTAEQLLASTEDKLKKTEGQPLSSNQQEMVTQIRQFMDQSKAAAAAGDLNRARNLAVKANLLSDELAKPQP